MYVDCSLSCEYACGLFTILLSVCLCVCVWMGCLAFHVASLVSCKCVPAFSPFAVLLVWPTNFLLISVFLSITLNSPFTQCHTWLTYHICCCCLYVTLLQVTCGARVKRSEMNLYIYKEHTALSFMTNIYFIYWSPLWTGHGRMCSLSCTVLNYKSSYLYRKCDGHCHAVGDCRLVCGMRSINTWLLLIGKWWYIFVQSAMQGRDTKYCSYNTYEVSISWSFERWWFLFQWGQLLFHFLYIC